VKVLVIGRRGLIGSAVIRSIFPSQAIFGFESTIRWGKTQDAILDLQVLLGDFCEFVGQEKWIVLWSAGKGHLGSTTEEMETEEALFQTVLQTVSKWTNTDGLIGLVSSAGAIWSASSTRSVSEKSPPSGRSPYALSKLRQEALLAETCQRSQIRGLAARVSSVYGINQDLSKPQGLISRLCASTVARRSIEIFVPLETTRNFIFSDDAASMIAGTLTKILERDELRGRSSTRVICSRENYSIATICKAVELVVHRKPLVVSKITRETERYPLHFRLQTDHFAEISKFESTTLVAGISTVYKEMLGSFQAGRFAGQL
jgi:UDP-glucose 4-epimerase